MHIFAEGKMRKLTKAFDYWVLFLILHKALLISVFFSALQHGKGYNYELINACIKLS